MTAKEAYTLIGKCCCWFNVSMDERHKTERAELKALLLELDYKSAEKLLREQSVWGLKNSFALNLPAVFSMLNEKVKWARRRKGDK